MTCPFCGAKVWGDPCASVLSCRDCRAYAKNGRVIYKGDGGHKKRAERAAAKKAAMQKWRSDRIKSQADRTGRQAEAAAKVEAAFRDRAGVF